MRMYRVRLNLPDATPTRNYQTEEEKRNKAPLPARALQVGKDASILHQGLEAPGCIAKSVNRNAIHDLEPCGTGRMGTDDVNGKVIRQSAIQFMDKARFVIAAPPRIGRRQHQEPLATGRRFFQFSHCRPG